MLKCSFCLYIHSGEATDADTIINGHAVCYDHMDYVTGGDWTMAMSLAKKHAEGDNGKPG